jgi:hypothetical protein
MAEMKRDSDGMLSVAAWNFVCSVFAAVAVRGEPP